MSKNLVDLSKKEIEKYEGLMNSANMIRSSISHPEISEVQRTFNNLKYYRNKIPESREMVNYLEDLLREMTPPKAK